MAVALPRVLETAGSARRKSVLGWLERKVPLNLRGPAGRSVRFDRRLDQLMRLRRRLWVSTFA